MRLCQPTALLLLALSGCSLLFAPQGADQGGPADASPVDAFVAVPYSLTPGWQLSTDTITGAVDVGPSDIPVLAGHFAGTAQIQTTEFTSKGKLDLFLATLDPATGATIDRAHYGATGTEFVSSVSVGANNQIVLAGGLIGADTTVGGDGFDTASANPTIGFVATYDDRLTHQWSHMLDSNVGNSSVNGLSAGAGPIYISGGYAGDLVLPQSGGAGDLLAGLDGLAAYYSKYNPDGSFSGGHTAISGLGEERCASVFADGLGSAYIAGFFSQEIEFDAPVGTLPATAAPAMDFFVGRIGHSLDLHWVITIPGNSFAYPFMQATLGKNNRLVLVSEFAGDLSVPDVTVSLQTNSAEPDIALFVIDPEIGQILIAKSFPSLGTDRASDVTVGPDGEIAVVGRFSGAINFGGQDLIANGGDDAFVAVFDALGEHLWSKGYGTTTDDSAISAAFDSTGALYVSFRHQNGIDFGLGPLEGLNAGAVVKFVRAE